MEIKSFKKSGHFPSLLSAFLYFDISFMIWVLCGSVALYITKDFGLTDAEKATMVALPLLGGAILRIPMGILSDRIGCKKTGIIGMIITIIPLLWGWLGGTNLNDIHAIGLLLGVAGASFGVALPLAGRWYPPQYQGMAMGIAGAGNSGTAIATFFGPKIAEVYGWHSVFGFAIIPLLLVLVSFMLMAKDSPNQPEPKRLTEYLSVFRHADTWWFSLFYAITFGGFSGLASYLGIFFYDIYGDQAMSGGLTMVQIGYLVTITVIAGSIFQTHWGLYCRPHWRNEISSNPFCLYIDMRIPRNHDAELLSSHASYNQHNDGLPWYGERFRVPNCATTFQRRNWSDDRDCWCIRRFRRILAAKLYIRTAEASYR